MNNICYKINEPISATQFIEVLKTSTLGERRPIEDAACMEGMVANSNLMLSAWDDGKLIGVARSVTDFHYCCYLSDLAVDRKYQTMGIGKKLLQLTQEQLSSKCKIILLSAPEAKGYYSHLGFEKHNEAWVLGPNKKIKDI